MRNRYIFAAILTAICCIAAIVYALHIWQDKKPQPKQNVVRRIMTSRKPIQKPNATQKKKPKAKPKVTEQPFISGTITDTEGNPMSDVCVSNENTNCRKTLRHDSYTTPCRQTAKWLYTQQKTAPHTSISPL